MNLRTTNIKKKDSQPGQRKETQGETDPQHELRDRRELGQHVFEALAERFPDAHCELVHKNPFELLIATILSAQCTDDRVNMVTCSLFDELKTPEDYLALGREGLEERIKSLGLFHNKAKNILALCRRLVDDYEGKVPADLEELQKLPGVGRKTANVVASNAFGIPALAVDTHVFRVARRLGLAQGKTPDKVEEELKQVFERKNWGKAHHLLIFQGRRICAARKPQCSLCPLAKRCPGVQDGG